MRRLDLLKAKYPRQSQVINGSLFEYRYHQNKHSDVTFVLLTGALGPSDLFLFHFDEFAKSYSVILFDYPTACPTNQELSDAIAQLLRTLHVKAYLVGQSLGGFIAQIVAKQHPDAVEGMILSNTGTLLTDMDNEGTECLLDMLKQIDKFIVLMKILPFGIVKQLMKKAVLSYVKSEYGTDIMGEFIDEMMSSITKKHELHVNYLLKDMKNYWNMEKTDFAQYDNRVLLALSDDDPTFNDSVKQALISIVPNPVVVTNIRGGHLALFLNMDDYIKAVKDFIDQKY